MAEKTNPSETMVRTIKRVFRPGLIEVPTRTLDNKFEGLGLSSLPEYQAAIDALNKYANAAAGHFRRKYDEHR